MATVKAFSISGLKIWFWSNDHEPPHFHVKRAGEWEAKVSFLLPRDEMVQWEWCRKSPSRAMLNELTKLAERHRVELLEQWQQLRELEG